MTWVKICGTTNLEDALVAVDAGADAVGFVFYEKSPRCVTVEAAREIVEKLPERVEKIGVFVSPEQNPIEILFQAGLTGTQSYISMEGVAGSHSSGPKAYGISCFPRTPRIMMAFSMSRFSDPMSEIALKVEGFAKSRQNLPEGLSIPEGIFDTFVLDSGNAQAPGGTGKTFDWRKVAPLAEGMRRGGVKLVVAGGLTPENVGNAMEILKPWGVDVASGVEARPGKKDPEKVRAFVRAVREMDRKAVL
jgi:phosphoribosylanthranilate isomerase